MKRDYGIFHVSIKLLLRKANAMLILRDDKGRYDLPGGRIDNVEYRMPLEKVVAREVREELGAVRYTLGKPLFQCRVYHEPRDIFIFATVYEARYVSGAIRLSHEHQSYEWVDPAAFRFFPKDFADKDVFRAFKSYFKNGQ